MLLPRQQSQIRGDLYQLKGRFTDVQNSAVSIENGISEAFSLGVSALPRLLFPFLNVMVLVAMLYSVELRTKLSPGSKALEQTSIALQKHKYEKSHLLKRTFPIGIVTVIIVCFLGGRRIDGVGSIDMKLVGKSFGFWYTEATMDSCLDEGKASRPYFTIALTSVLQLILIFQLVSRIGGGHIVFAFKACGTLLSTTLAGTIDNRNWTIIAAGAATILSTCSIFGLFPTIPQGVPSIGVVAYLFTTIGTSIAYQLSQNISSTLAGTFLRIRYAAHMLSIGLGTPVAWILYDLSNNMMFLTGKVVLDKIALWALSYRQKKDVVVTSNQVSVRS